MRVRIEMDPCSACEMCVDARPGEPDRLDLNGKHGRFATEMGLRLALVTDAHSTPSCTSRWVRRAQRDLQLASRAHSCGLALREWQRSM
jgi:hypothetical protein